MDLVIKDRVDTKKEILTAREEKDRHEREEKIL